MKMCGLNGMVVACAATIGMSSVSLGTTTVEPFKIVYGAMDAQDDEQNQAVNVEVDSGKWYGRISAEAVFSNQTNLSVDGVAGSYDASGSTSFGIHGAVGYRFSESVSGEFEVGYIDMQYDAVNWASGGDSVSADASIDYVTLLVGPRFDFELTKGIDFFASGLIGLGIGHGTLTGTVVSGGSTVSGTESANATAFAYAVRTGLSFDLANNFVAMVNFRLDGSSEFDFSGLHAMPLALGVEAGVSFSF